MTIVGTTHVCDVGSGEANVSHDGNHHVLLYVELSWVEAPRVPEGTKFASWEDLLQEFTSWEGTAYHNLSAVVQCD